MKARLRSIGFATVALIAPLGFALTRGDEGESDPPPPVSSDLAVALMRTQLDAENLCAAGLSASQVTTLLDPVATHFDANPSMLAGFDQACANARVQRDQLRRLVRSGQGTQDDVVALSQASQDLENATAVRDTYFQGLWDIVLNGAGPLESTRLEKVRGNRSWKLPTRYLVTDRTESDWVDLRAALAVRRIHENYGDPFPQETQLYLATIEADLEVAAATVSLDTNLAAVQTAWNEAVSD